MDSTANVLYEYLQNIIKSPQTASLDVDALPEEFKEFGDKLKHFAQDVTDALSLAGDLSRGDLTSPPPPRRNIISSPLKALQASLRHLTWKTRQIAQGDYSQRVDFMGEFSESFNSMTEQVKRKTHSLEQGNLLLTGVMHYAPIQILVLNEKDEILLANEIVEIEIARHTDYVARILKLVKDAGGVDESGEITIEYIRGVVSRYFLVHIYPLEWQDSNARAITIHDISNTKNQMDVLEIKAYRDSMTSLYNRAYAMMTLDDFVYEKRCFSVIFADLDNLKYINDKYGHNEGDMYIITAAKYLNDFSQTAVTCRIGGDEFMIIVPDIDYDAAYMIITQLAERLQTDDYLTDKEYTYRMSFGVADIRPENNLSVSEILSIADERMYENKRANKMARKGGQGRG